MPKSQLNRVGAYQTNLSFMKKSFKLFGLIALVGGVIFVVACSKDSGPKTCECTVSVTVSGYTQTQTVSGEIESGDCSDAEDMPGIQEVKDALGGYGSINVSCHEK
jgi:hypothetical protein